MQNMQSTERVPLAAWVPFLGAAVLIFMLYWNTFLWWWREWTYPGSFYAHAVFVPFFVAVMVWRNRERLAATPWQPSWVGIVPVLLAMVVLMLAKRSDVTVVQSLSFMLLLIGGAMLLLGLAWTRILLFPLFFLIMMMPLVPDQLINSIAFPIQLASANIATKLLNAITLSATQQGTVIQLENYRMAVEMPCSGFKTLISLMTFSAAFAYLVEAANWKRWTLFLTTVPLSLVINALRITLIGVVGELFSSKAASAFHDYSGFIVLVIAFVFLFNFARVLRCESFLGVPLTDEPEEKAGPTHGDAVSEENVRQAEEELKEVLGSDAQDWKVEEVSRPVPPPTVPWWKELLAMRPGAARVRQVQPFVIATCAVLLLTLGVQGYATRPPKQLPPIATSQVPIEFTVNGHTWKADTTQRDFDRLPRDVQEVLNPSRVINRTYKSAQGGVQLFITAGNGRKVFHDPHTCALGSNARVMDVRVLDIPTEHGTIRVQESRYKYIDMPDEFVLMFFYVVEDQVVQRTEQVRNRMIWQMLMGDSGKPSYFIRATQLMPGTEEVYRQQMIEFLTGLWNAIGPILTGKQEARYEPPPVPTNETLLPQNQ